MTGYKLKTGTEEDWSRLEAREQLRFEVEQKDIENAPVSPLHENLRHLRMRMKLKKQEMADLLEITPRTYYTYEEGARPIPSTTLVRLAVRTGVDLNKLLLGRSASANPQLVQSAIDDMFHIMKYLTREYPKMDMTDKLEVARFSVSFDWQGWPRLHPDMIRDAVKMVTRYRFHPEDLPAPPDPEHYGEDTERYQEDEAIWQAMVDEDLGPMQEEHPTNDSSR
ncbi:helix-turn-helix domain-containing protein [Roseinatronobacter monicus]|uniref:Helix-turn-helix protein n=1 Tax=Roseinatronobacter monicus TaxID=393481 RepID=A0A543KF17_9RHOB|nr:helix-turn-helix transcriptional regulator [Roseinatronobacter monicus]TQM93617.1 helix-turn-helix protein [Roseinatronobacter monicus]